jgi:uncharacterized protein YndB with AHSA1/START domain
MIAISGRRAFAIHVRSPAPPATVFALLADVQSWNRWSPIPRASLERVGAPPPHGAGAICRFPGGPFATREQVVAYEPPRHFGYILLSGLPVRDYRAEVTLTPTASGTSIAWRGSFNALIPGTGPLLLWLLRRIVHAMARGLARHAGEVAAGEAAST